MPRETNVTIHLYEDISDPSSVLPFNDAQKATITQQLTSLFTSPPHLSQSGAFTCRIAFGHDIPGESFRKSDGELLQDLEPLGATAPSTRVLIAQSSARPLSPQGLMFDVGGRQGCAVFVRAIESSFLADKERLLIRTIAHELGHVFNLAHEDSLQQNRQILFDPASLDGITTPAISDDCWEHLLRHDADSVRPGSGITFGGRRCNSLHPPSDFSVMLAGQSSGAATPLLKLHAAPGSVYPNPSRPTFVIGEPIHLNLTLTNRSRRALRVPCFPATATQDMIILRLDPAGEIVSLSPPLLFCTAPSQRGWQRVESGSTAIFRETLLFRRGELVFPREGTFRLIAGLRLRGRWIASDPVIVRIAPPLEKRHERSSAVVAEPEVGLFFELGGTYQSSRALERLVYLRRTNPKFPLNPMALLLEGRRKVMAEAATPEKTRAQLAQIASTSALPKRIRTEAELLLLLDRAQDGERRSASRLRRRLADDSRLPVESYTAHLMKHRLENI